jgi:hypothetical protein
MLRLGPVAPAQGALQVQRVEPAAVLAADGLEAAGFAETCSAVEGDGGGLGAANDGDHLAETGLLGGFDQLGEEGATDATAELGRVNVDAVLTGEAVAGAVPQRGGIGVAGEFGAALGDQEWSAAVLRFGDQGGEVLGRAGIEVEAGDARQDVVGVNGSNRSGVGRGSGADEWLGHGAGLLRRGAPRNKW